MRKTISGVQKNANNVLYSSNSEDVKGSQNNKRVTARHTKDHFRCPACNSFRGPMTDGVVPSLPFPVAARNWLDTHSRYIKKRTIQGYEQNIKTLGLFLGEVLLQDIHIGTVRAFQEDRSKRACATRTNAETSVLQMILKEAELWDRIGPLYKPLPVSKEKVRQNMSADEEEKFLSVALKKPKRRLAGHCLIVMANTSMGFGELRHLRKCDVFLSHSVDGDELPFVEVNGGTKNDYRIRSIYLNSLALKSMRWIMHRFEELGGSKPEDFILPHRSRTRGGPVDFTEPQGHIYRAARGILADAGLSHLDPYDMRSHAITKLLEDPNVSDQMYEEITGHRGKAMRRRYSKQRMENKKKALDAFLVTKKQPIRQVARQEMVVSEMSPIPIRPEKFVSFRSFRA